MLKINKLVYFFIILFVIRISIFKVAKSSISLDFFSIAQILIVVLIFSLLLLQKQSSLKPLLNDSSVNLLSIIYFIGIISYVWSALPAFSLYMAFQNLVFLSAIFYLASLKGSFEELEHFLFQSSFVWIFIDAFGDFYQNGISLIFHWHNLETGGISGMLFCYSLGELLSISKYAIFDPRRKSRLRKVAIVSFIILLLSTSSGANVAVLVGLLSLALISKNLLLKIGVVLVILFFFLVPTVLSNFMAYIFPDKSIVGISTIGYRTFLWESIWDLIKQKPILGWGYASVERISSHYAVDSHNSILGIVGGLGFVGGVLLIIYFLNITVKTYRKQNHVGYLGLFSGLICMIANSNTFGFLSSKTSLLSISFFTIVTLTYFYKLNPYESYEE